MALRSRLLGDDARLRAAAVSSSSHVQQPDRGPHVDKIQVALNRLDEAKLVVDGVFGSATAAAVLAFKRKRNIVNRDYQTAPDAIVGQMTIAALDAEMVLAEQIGPLDINVRGVAARYHVRRHPAVPPFNRQLPVAWRRLQSGIRDAGPQTPTPPIPATTPKTVRLPPNSATLCVVMNTARNTIAVCRNLPDPVGGVPFVAGKIVFISDFSSQSTANASPDIADGGTVSLTQDPHNLRLELFRPGNATITVMRADAQIKQLVVEVRADRKGAALGNPLKKLTAGSRFFSAEREEGGEAEVTSTTGGRPVNPRRGGKLINLSGEEETPEFEDYQVDLANSQGLRGGFRPWTEDSDPTVGLANGSASHITMRGTPLKKTFLPVIKRIAQPGCLFTFSGEKSFISIIKNSFPGREMEPPLTRGEHVNLAWEIS